MFIILFLNVWGNVFSHSLPECFFKNHRIKLVLLTALPCLRILAISASMSLSVLELSRVVCKDKQ